MKKKDVMKEEVTKEEFLIQEVPTKPIDITHLLT
jgi:hypothetical protein